MPLTRMALYNYTQALTKTGVKRVVVCQIVRRQDWRHLTLDEGIAGVTDINEFLRTVYDDKHLSFWQHKAFWSVQKQTFRRDGVYSNDFGNYKLRRNVKGGILCALKSVQKQ